MAARTQSERDDLAQAYRACLDPDTEAAPTPQQKQMVLDHIANAASMRAPMFSRGSSENDLLFLEGNRNMGLLIFAQIERDPLYPKQKKAE